LLDDDIAFISQHHDCGKLDIFTSGIRPAFVRDVESWAAGSTCNSIPLNTEDLDGTGSGEPRNPSAARLWLLASYRVLLARPDRAPGQSSTIVSTYPGLSDSGAVELCAVASSSGRLAPVRMPQSPRRCQGLMILHM
jgi:hypothetical protein